MEQLSNRRKIAIAILAALALVALSLWGGILIAQNWAKKTAAQGTNIRTTIAVVNMDGGVDYNGKTVNYANSFISTLGDNVTVVSASAAADGFKNGVYGGVITIPADMSAKIVSINAENPIQVALTYVINDQLPKEKYIDVYQRINDAQQSLRSSLAYVFETSIFDDIHKSQANVNKVKTNDTADLNAVNALRQTNFMVGLKIADLPDAPSDYQGYGDTEKIVTASDLLGKDVGGLYQGEYLAMQDGYTTAQTNIGLTQQHIISWETAQEDYLSRLETAQTTYLGQVASYHQTLSDFYTGLMGYDQSATAYDASMNTYQQKLTDYKSALDAYRDNLASYSVTIPGLPTDLESIVVTDTAGPVPVYTPLDQKYTTGIYKDGAPSPQSTIQSGADNLSSIISGRPSGAELSGYFDAQNLAITTYDPSVFFTKELEDKVGSTISAFNGDVSTLRSSLDSKQSDNIAKLGQAHSGYQNYAAKVSSDTLAKYDADGKSLENALNGFYQQKLGASKDNTDLFADISGLLPYSQVNGATNQKVTEFIVDPLAVTQQPYLGVTTAGFDIRRFLQTSLLVIAGSSVLAILLLMFIKRRKEREFQV